MKTTIKLIFGLFLLLSFQIKGQSVKRVQDPNIVAQEKRQVFQQWGEWRPYPNYNFFGIQTNIAYMNIWGWLSPRVNRDYKRGSDIRPLGPAGLQNQRYVSTKQEESETEKVLKEVRDVYNVHLDEQLHYSSVTVPTDPLYLLYYKTMLKDLQEFDTNSPIASQWGFTNTEAFERFERLGMMGESKRKLDVLQNRLELSKSMEIPRGKRIMMWHECLVEWRKIKNYLTFLNRQGTNTIKEEGQLSKLKESKKNGGNSLANRDAQIFVDTYLRVAQ
jgi:hypothetical protein